MAQSDIARASASVGGTAIATILPDELLARLKHHAEITGDDIADVIADALTLHFDALDGADVSATELFLQLGLS